MMNYQKIIRRRKMIKSLAKTLNNKMIKSINKPMQKKIRTCPNPQPAHQKPPAPWNHWPQNRNLKWQHLSTRSPSWCANCATSVSSFLTSVPLSQNRITTRNYSKRTLHNQRLNYKNTIWSSNSSITRSIKSKTDSRRNLWVKSSGIKLNLNSNCNLKRLAVKAQLKTKRRLKSHQIWVSSRKLNYWPPCKFMDPIGRK